MEQRENFKVLDLASKWRSKKELYNMLVREGGIYLPPNQEATQKYLRDLMMGKKKFIKSENILAIKVPQYKGLTVKSIIEFAQRNIHIDKYLPDYEYSKENNREWVWNIVNTIIPEKFKRFIDQKVEERKQQIIKSQNLGISVNPEFMSIFKSSNSVSFVKGKSHFLARLPRPSKEQKNIQELEEEKREIIAKAENAENKLEELKLKLEELQNNLRDADDNAAKLAKLYELGIINASGEPIDNDMN